jgi:hypothetical protein
MHLRPILFSIAYIDSLQKNKSLAMQWINTLSLFKVEPAFPLCPENDGNKSNHINEYPNVKILA